MRTLTLPDGARTSQLGFGCSSLMGAMTRSESVRSLESAFDAGVRHFDAAPMYGYGQAEGCLGELLSRHPGEVTLTTKYGIPPARNQFLLGFGRRLARPVVRLLPGMKRRLTRAAGAISGSEPKSSFTPDQARASLETSLRELRTDHIHLWLLHEIEADDLNDDTLLRVLEDAVRSGEIGAFGVASGREKLPSLLEHQPALCNVAQFEWSVLDPGLAQTPYLRLHHRALSEPFQRLRTALERRSDLRDRWSAEVGHDLSQGGTLARLMLGAALERNPESIILFSSKSPAHMAENVRLAGDASLAAPAIRLHQLVQQHLPDLFPIVPA